MKLRQTGLSAGTCGVLPQAAAATRVHQALPSFLTSLALDP